MANLSKLWANFSVYGAYKNAPEALTIWIIYAAIDRYGSICIYGSMWSKMVLRGGIWRAGPLHI